MLTEARITRIKASSRSQVFLTNFRDTVTSDRLMTKAAIVQPKQWCKYAVKGFEPENVSAYSMPLERRLLSIIDFHPQMSTVTPSRWQVFVCEERYLGKQLHFKKIKVR